MAALVAAVQQSLCPPGSIMAYGGTTAPTGWLLCNGASVSRTTYATLYAAIGNNYGTADGSNFNLPDFRGRFLRGSTTDSNRDPNFSTRVASNTGGNTGGNVGSYQADAFKEHTHSYNDIFHSEVGGTVSVTNNWGSGDSDNDNRGSEIARTSGTTGGSETRPVNVTVNYIIKH
jgi:microcystin-dependent protein